MAQLCYLQNILDIIYARYRYAIDEKQDMPGLVIPESIGEAEEGHAEAKMIAMATKVEEAHDLAPC